MAIGMTARCANRTAIHSRDPVLQDWIQMDNQGAIFLTQNESTARTRHIDVRYHFLRELTEGPDPVIKIIYVPSAENKADVYTKNVPVHIFRKAFLEERLKEA